MKISSMLKFIYEELTMSKWNIGFTGNSPDLILTSKKPRIKYLKHDYKNKWFADPFILNMTENEIDLLVEEYDNKIKKGRIAKLVISRNNLRLISMKIVLDLESHLSFPAIYRVDNEVYVCPENSQSGGYFRYTYDFSSEKLIYPELIINKPLTDAVEFQINNVNYIFSTKLPNPHGNKLYIFSNDDEGNKFKVKQEVILSDKTARSAGHLLKVKGKLIRPAQDCNKSYGKGLVFQEIINKNGRFKVKELKRVYNTSIKYGLGMHTFNTFGNVAVVDVSGYKYIILGRICNTLRVFIKYIYQFFK